MIGDFIIPQEYNIMIYLLLRTNFYNVTPLTYYHTLSMKTSAFGTLSSPKCTTELPIHLPGRNTFFFSEKVSVLVYLSLCTDLTMHLPSPPARAVSVAHRCWVECRMWRMAEDTRGAWFQKQKFQNKGQCPCRFTLLVAHGRGHTRGLVEIRKRSVPVYIVARGAWRRKHAGPGGNLKTNSPGQ